MSSTTEDQQQQSSTTEATTPAPAPAPIVTKEATPQQKKERSIVTTSAKKTTPKSSRSATPSTNNNKKPNSQTTKEETTGGESQQLTDEEKKELRQKKEAEEVLLQQQRIQMMQMRINSMSDTNSVERRRAEILRNVKLGDGVDRSYAIEGEFLFESDKVHQSSTVDKLDEKMKKVVSSSPERLKRKIIMSPTADDSGASGDEAGFQQQQRFSSSSLPQNTNNNSAVVMPSHHHHQEATPSRSPLSSSQQRQRSPPNNNNNNNNNNDISREIESMGQNIANLVAQLNNNGGGGGSASRGVSSAERRTVSTYSDPNHHHHQQQQQQATPMMNVTSPYYDASSPSSYGGNNNNSSYYDSYNNNNNDDDEHDSRLQYMNIGDDPQDPLRSSPARNAVDLLRRDAMSDGGIMLPHTKMRLRSLARRSSPVLSRIPPYRQTEAAIAAANVEEHKKQQRVAQEKIRVSAMVDVAGAALKRKEKEFHDAAKYKKQEVRQQGHKNYTEELAERAFRRKHGISFDEIAPATPKVRAKTPTTGQKSSTAKKQQQQRRQDESRGINGYFLDDDTDQDSKTVEGDNESQLTASNTTATGNNTETRGFSDVQQIGNGDSGKIGRAASTILLCSQVIRGFVAPTIAAVTAAAARSESDSNTTTTNGGGSPSNQTHGTNNALRLAEQSVLQGVEAAAIAVDNLLRDPSYQLESLHSVETMLENALKLHNSLNAGSRGVSELSNSQHQQQQQPQSASNSQLPYQTANFMNTNVGNNTSNTNSPSRAMFVNQQQPLAVSYPSPSSQQQQQNEY